MVASSVQEAFFADYGLEYCTSAGAVMQVVSEKQAYQFLEGYKQRNGRYDDRHRFVLKMI